MPPVRAISNGWLDGGWGLEVEDCSAMAEAMSARE
jgi:hypothetical protein